MLSVVFLGPGANPDLEPIINVALHVSYTAVTKILAKPQPSQRDQNSHYAAPPQKKRNSSPCAQFLSCSAYSQQSTSRHPNFFLPIVFLLWYQPTAGGTLWRTTSRKVAGSIPVGITGIFHWHNSSGRTMTLGLTQPQTEMSRGQLKCNGTRAETRFRLSAKRTSPFKSAGASVQSTTGSRGVRISGSNAGYTMFRGSVKGTGYPLHSPVSPSLPLPCVTVCHHISTGVYLSSSASRNSRMSECNINFVEWIYMYIYIYIYIWCFRINKYFTRWYYGLFRVNKFI